MVVRTHIHPDLTIYSQELSGWTVSTAEFNANERFHQAATSIWPLPVQDNVSEGDDQYILPFTPTLISNTMYRGGMHSPLSRLLRLVSRTATVLLVAPTKTAFNMAGHATDLDAPTCNGHFGRGSNVRRDPSPLSSTCFHTATLVNNDNERYSTSLLSPFRAMRDG